MNNESAALEKGGLRELLLALPKTEIHLHLEALATADTVWKLAKKNGLRYEGVKSKADLIKKFQITTLDEFINVFINIIQNSFKTEEDFAHLIDDAGAYLKKNNIVYAEVFFAPTKFLKSGFRFEKIVEVLSGGVQKIKNDCGSELKLLIDVSRTFGAENAMNNLNLTLQNRCPDIIGIGLGGAEAAGPARDYTDVFKKAAENGLHAVAHSGEDVGPEAVWETINSLAPERIGHGISAVQDEKLIDYLADKAILLEICPTSNLFTRKYVHVIQEHPIRAFWDKKLFVTVNSDDPTLFSTSLVDEYMLLYNNGIFSRDEILALLANNIEASFLPAEKKDELKQKTAAIIAGQPAS